MSLNTLSWRAGFVGAVFAIAGAVLPGPGLHATVAHASTDFLTSGTALLDANTFMTPNSYWRIQTGEGASSPTPIAEDFYGPADGGVAEEDLGDWTEAYSSEGSYGDEDDNYVEVPLGFSTNFNDHSYQSVFIGSNTYFTFGRGSWEYSDLSPSNPRYPGVHVGSDDHSFQRVLYREDDPGVLRVRYEGTDETEGTLGSPNIIYEVVFYSGQNYFDLYIGDHADIGDLLDPSFYSASGIDSNPVGYELIGSAGTWDRGGDFSYQWERSSTSDLEGEWTPIEGAHELNYMPTDADAYKYVRLAVTLDDGETPPETHTSDPEIGEVRPVIEVSTCQELQDMDVDGGDDDAYVLTADIDCSDMDEFSPLDWDGDDFGGMFDGQHHTIANLHIVGTDINTGLFSYVDGGFMRDFTLDHATVSVPDEHYGGTVVGFFNPEWDYVMDNVHVVNSSVTSMSGYTGGLIGAVSFDEKGYQFTISNSSYVGDVATAAIGYVGGLIGSLWANADADVMLDQLYFHGTIDLGEASGFNAGGAVGFAAMQTGSISMNEIATEGTIIAPGYSGVGGLIGDLDVYSDEGDVVASTNFSLSDSYADMDITGAHDLGGIIGTIDAAPSSQGDSAISIENTYGAGSITATSGYDVGGLTGFLEGTYEDTAVSISDSFAASTLGESGESYGGVIGNYQNGDFDPALTDVHFDGTRLNLNRCDGGSVLEDCFNENNTGEDDGYFFDRSNFPMAAWDFSDVWFERGTDYPILRFIADIPDPTADFLADHGHGRAKRLQQIFGDDWQNIMNGGASVTPEAPTGDAQADPGKGDDSSDVPTDTVPDESVDTSPAPVMQPSYDGIESHYSDYYGHQVASDSTAMGISPWDATSEPISSVRPGWYIRGEHFDTVYEMVYDDATHSLVRRPFWDVPTFFTYENSWDHVVWVTDATLAVLHTGTPMPPKPGAVLVQIQGNSEVYAVGEDQVGRPTLRLIPDERTALAVYGATWADYVINYAPTAWVLFGEGAPVSSTESVDKSHMKTRVSLYQH